MNYTLILLAFISYLIYVIYINYKPGTPLEEFVKLPVNRILISLLIVLTTKHNFQIGLLLFFAYSVIDSINFSSLIISLSVLTEKPRTATVDLN